MPWPEYVVFEARWQWHFVGSPFEFFRNWVPHEVLGTEIELSSGLRPDAFKQPEVRIGYFDPIDDVRFAVSVTVGSGQPGTGEIARPDKQHLPVFAG
jgi:hypothetical protein